MLKLFILNLEKERRERKIRGNEMRRKYRERSIPNTNEDVEESMYSIISLYHKIYSDNDQ